MENKKIKVLLFVYAAINLGDNIFVYTLLKKYPEIDFYLQVKDEEYKKIYKDFKNIHFLSEPRDVRIVNVDNYDAFIYVGGSIFMESEYAIHEMKEFNYLISKCNEKNKKFFYMSSNFGPYKTKEYLDLAKNTFELSAGICFRDKNSYELFKNVENVKYAPDMAFSLEMPVVKKEENTIGISVINLEKRENLKHKTAIYEDLIKRIIIKFAKRNYKVTLFSFSQFEGDDKAIERIISSVPEEYKDKVHKVIFDGNIEKYIRTYAKMEYMVCTRFHSMIISLLCKQKIFNITYSKKQDNVIKDYNLFWHYKKIKDLTYETKVRKIYFSKVADRKLKKIVKKSQKQFENLENVKNEILNQTSKERGNEN